MANINDIIRLIEASKEKEDSRKTISKSVLIYTNLSWVIVLLVIIICIICAIDITKLQDRDLIVGITNFATVLSIILSISSIAFAYFTSRDTNNQYIAMGKALEEVRATNFQMSLSNSDLISQVNSIATEVSVLNTKYDLQSILSRPGYDNTRPLGENKMPSIPGNNPKPADQTAPSVPSSQPS